MVIFNQTVLSLFSSTAEREELEDNRVHGQEDEDDVENENDQPLDLTVKRSDADSGAFIASIQRPLVVRERTSSAAFVENGLHGMEKAELVVSVSIQKENGIDHPKKRNWLKMEEEDDSFPHEIEEWKKTFTSGLCG